MSKPWSRAILRAPDGVSGFGVSGSRVFGGLHCCDFVPRGDPTSYLLGSGIVRSSEGPGQSPHNHRKTPLMISLDEP